MPVKTAHNGEIQTRSRAGRIDIISYVFFTLVINKDMVYYYRTCKKRKKLNIVNKY